MCRFMLFVYYICNVCVNSMRVLYVCCSCTVCVLCVLYVYCVQWHAFCTYTCRYMHIMIPLPLMLIPNPPSHTHTHTHTQFYDLLELFRTGGELPDTSYVFMVSTNTHLISLCSFVYCITHAHTNHQCGMCRATLWTEDTTVLRHSRIC